MEFLPAGCARVSAKVSYLKIVSNCSMGNLQGFIIGLVIDNMKLTILILAWLLAMPASAEILAVSREANRVLVFDKAPEIWSVQSWKRRVKIQTRFSCRDNFNATLSRDGKLAAIGRKDGTIELFETHSAHLWRRLGRAQTWRINEENSFHYRDIAVSALAFSPNRRLLASGNGKGIFVWRVRDGKLLFSRPLHFHPFDFREGAWRLAAPVQFRFSPNGRTVAIGSTGPTEVNPLFLLSVESRRLRHVTDIDSGDGTFNAMAFSPGGNRVFVASNWHVSMSGFSEFRLFDSRSGRILWKRDNLKAAPEGYVEQTDEETNSAAFASNGRLIAIGGPEFVEIRRARDGKLLSRQYLTEAQSQTSGPNFQRERRFRAELAVR